jgi:hypothetical protein
MKKRIIYLFLALVLIAAILVPALARGADGNATISVTATMDFPTTLTFDISVKNDVTVTDIRLHYTVDKLKFADVISEEVVAFNPSKNIGAQYVMDMRQTGGMPPGSRLTYWLTVTDASGAVTESLPQAVAIEDGRYDWKKLQEGKVTLYWYKGTNAFAADLMVAVQQALVTVAQNSGAELKNPVKLYIYASSADLVGALIFAQDWTGGIAFSEYGIMAIGIGTSPSEIAWGKSTISHELTHLVVHQVIFNPYNGIPTWLDEGLAMVSEGTLDIQFTSALAAADSMISVQSLCSPFSAYADQAVLAYAESYEIVRYLIDTYGSDKLSDLLDTFKNGSGNDEALKAVYGFDMASLNQQWQTAGVKP